ncbi:28S ribosomal protein S31, mitochondrial-like [Actinia tenebrosa]|uniref:Small ribosomal subunit protein mS31 n=1 Tax=Actinia tenebrosa TaxID=6105 RepID=A0A6P8HKR0_ACTTE|nr:28S ribosomal protein S31, mitochondrial-like [Actinia tenebrosa]
MSLLSRAFCTRYFKPTSFQRIAPIRYHRAYSTGSSDGGDKPSKSGISSLLSSLKRKDKNGDLKEILQRGKQLKEPQKDTLETVIGNENRVKSVAAEGSVKSSMERLSQSSVLSEDDVKAGTRDERLNARETPIPSPPFETTKTSDVSDTMKKMLKKDAANPTLSPEIHGKLKSILSKLKIDSAQTNLSKDIIGAAKSWGRVSPRYRKDIVSDYKMQSRKEALQVTREISLTDGARFNLFDNIFGHSVASKEPPSKLSLLEGIEMEMLLRYEALDQRNDFISLIEIADKQWKFPVDNEVCKVEEESVSFEEHVFLGYLLDGFPKKGPVRRFMELVINGLEQNPHMTVAQKKGQVEWFKEYFDNIPEGDLSF